MAKLVRVRGRVSIAFEEFSLDSTECGASASVPGSTPVWLNYGGDEGAPTVYCCGDHSRKPGDLPEYQGKPIPLFRDDQLVEFSRRITAQRLVRPDGLTCHGRECYFYDVTVTITGHFLAVQKTKEGGWVGYGHLGCCHSLFIEKVSDVEARRTDVPAGGEFDCGSDVWDVPLSEGQAVLANYKRCAESKTCDDVRRDAVLLAAKHWGHSANEIRNWTGSYRGEADYMWSSPDFLTTYTLEFPYTNPHLNQSRSSFVITRNQCSVTQNPLPRSTRVHCEEMNWEAENPRGKAKNLQDQFESGCRPSPPELQAAAWATILDVMRERNIRPLPNMVLDECLEHEFGEDKQGYCSWMSKDGMQSVSAALIRYAFLKAGKRTESQIVWVATGVNVATCGAD